jgi:hypothetical protein
MATLLGALNIKDSERPFTTTAGIQLVWDYTMQIVARYNEEVDAGTKIFVQGDTREYKEVYELPGGGYLEEEGFEGSPTAEIKRGGRFDVSYPLRQYGASIGYNEIGLAYLEMGQYEATIQTVLNQNSKTVFRDILGAIFNNAPPTFNDFIRGSLTIRALANQDGTLYPQTFGSDAPAEENFYLAPGYAESGISNTNNPFTAIINKFEPHFGSPTGGSHVVVFINNSALQYAKALADFVSVTYHNVEPGDQTPTARLDINGVPLPPGSRIVGVCDGATIVQWNRIPSGWMVGALPGVTPPPLKRRIDDEKSRLTPGLQLAAEGEKHPYFVRRWRNRYGYGVGNRLGMVVVALNGTGTYTVPTTYAR